MEEAGRGVGGLGVLCLGSCTILGKGDSGGGDRDNGGV